MSPNEDIGSEILPGLFIGNMYTAQNKMFFKNKKIGAVLNATPDVPNYFISPGEQGVEYMRINVNDNNLDVKKMYRYLPCAVSFIYKNLVLDQKPTLVHCHAGVQRSASIVVAFLMKTKELCLNDAVQYVQRKRPVVFSNGRNGRNGLCGRNINFKQALIQFASENKCL